MEPIVLKNVIVVGVVGIAHVQCMCVSCHYHARYTSCGEHKESTIVDNIEDVMERRDQYYGEWSDHCMPIQMLLIASKEQWARIPDIAYTGHIAGVLSDSSHLQGVRRLEDGDPFQINDVIRSKGCIEENIGDYQIGWLWRNISVPDTTRIPKMITNLGGHIFELADDMVIERCDVKINFVGHRADVMFKHCQRMTTEEVSLLIHEE